MKKISEEKMHLAKDGSVLYVCQFRSVAKYLVWYISGSARPIMSSINGPPGPFILS